MRCGIVLYIIFFLFFSFTFCKAQLVADTFNVPHYPIPDIYYTEFAPELPPTVNNRILSFFPRDFYEQNLPNCNQASGIYYCLTYQYNRLLNRSADSLSSFAPNYTFNFLNGGYGWYGASTFDSWNIVKSQGNPTEGIFDGYKNIPGNSEEIDFEGKYWMKGYEKYYLSMKYRIKDYYAIDVSTDEGLKMLKHYLSDHFEGSQYGGVAVFSSGINFLSNAPFGYVNDSIVSYPFDSIGVHKSIDYGQSHNLTVTGYYENNKIDFNGDGIITDTIDINSDGIVNYLDNERTLWIIVNSNGEDEIRSLFLLKFSEISKVWNKIVFFPIPDTSYAPKLTFKIKMKHKQRNSFKISAGISSDLKSKIPEKIIDFPIFHYQGGNQPLSGIDTFPVPEELEFGIDITDILDYVDTKGVARIFFRLDNSGHEPGLLDYCSLMDYSGSEVREFIINDHPLTISQAQIFELYTDINLQTTASEEKLNITGDNEFIIFNDENFGTQISLKGGTPPYYYKIINNQEYMVELTNRDYVYSNSGFSTINNEYIKLDWPIPFAGEFFDSLAISTKGTITFSGKNQLTEEIYPYMFFKEAVYEDITISTCNGFFFNGLYWSKYFMTDSSIVLWQRRLSTGNRIAVRTEIFKDGRIEVYIKDTLGITPTTDYARHFGILTFTSSYFSPQIPLGLGGNFNTTVFKPNINNSLFNLSDEGYLEMSDSITPGKYELHVMVIDSTGEKAVKRFEINILDRALDFLLYPNPTSELITISFNTLENDVAKIEIFNLTGNLQLSKLQNVISGKNDCLLDVSMLSPGLYLCKISKSNLNKTLKFIVLEK